jgi:hypothetical protein
MRLLNIKNYFFNIHGGFLSFNICSMHNQLYIELDGFKGLLYDNKSIHICLTVLGKLNNI